MRTYTASECVKRSKTKPLPHCLVSLAEDCLSSTQGDPCRVLVTDVCKNYIVCAAPKTSNGTTDS